MPIPHIIHQTWKTDDVPEAWVESQQKWQSFCMEHGFEYRFWNDEQCRELIGDEYPNLLEMYDKLPLGIQRSHVARYAIMHARGGIYTDMDIAPLDNSERTKLFLTTIPGEYHLTLSEELQPNGRKYMSTSFMSSTQGHDLWKYILDELPKQKLSYWDKAWTNTFRHYDVVMRTGSHFLTKMYNQWKEGEDAAFILPEQWMRPQDGQRSPFIKTVSGGPGWSDWDSSLAKMAQKAWFHRDLILVGITLVMILTIVLLAIFR